MQDQLDQLTKFELLKENLVLWTEWSNVSHYDIQDCTLYQHVFQDASRPASKANPQGISVNSKGDVTYVSRVNMNPVRGSAKLSGILRKAPLHSEQFCQANSVMHRFLCKSPRDRQSFHECARRYILTGQPFADICDHNAAVAKDLNRHHVSISLHARYISPIYCL